MRNATGMDCPYLWLVGEQAEKLAKGKTDGKAVEVKAKIAVEKVEMAQGEPLKVKLAVHSIDGHDMHGATEYGPVEVGVGMVGKAKWNKTVEGMMKQMMGDDGK